MTPRPPEAAKPQAGGPCKRTQNHPRPAGPCRRARAPADAAGDLAVGRVRVVARRCDRGRRTCQCGGRLGLGVGSGGVLARFGVLVAPDRWALSQTSSTSGGVAGSGWAVLARFGVLVAPDRWALCGLAGRRALCGLCGAPDRGVLCETGPS